MGLDLTFHNNAWEGRYYLNGDIHAYKRDKLKVKVWQHDGYASIMVYEQGGDCMSLQNWLVTYGGASDYKHAENIMEGNSASISFKRLYINRNTVAIQYVTEDEYREFNDIPRHRCNLYNFMCRYFGENKVSEVWDRYKVTTDKYGNVVWWYLNADGKICYDKVMRYGQDGHRDKSFGGSRRFKTDMGYRERPLFGAHLLSDSDEKIYVVESEKSALITACITDRLVVATGGKTNLKDTDSRFILLPDIDAVDEWANKGKIFEWWRNWGSSSVTSHADVADMILFLRKHGMQNDEVEKQVFYK
jgi:hypothetical protein